MSAANPVLSPAHGANFFFRSAAAEQAPLTLTHLLAMTYVAHGWHLALTGLPLFDEPVHADPHGPLVRSLYHEFKRFADRPITRYGASQVDFDSGAVTYPAVPIAHTQSRDVLARVWDIYRRLQPAHVMDRLRRPRTPWHQTRAAGPGGAIDNDLTRTWYVRRLQLYLDNARTPPRSAVTANPG